MSETASFLRAPQPMPEWRKLLEVCEQKGVKPAVLLRPEEHMEARHVADRGSVLKVLRFQLEWTIPMIRELLPHLSERNIVRLTKKD